MSAVRLARAATGRDLVVKFAGGYHGHSDGLLVEAGSGRRDARDPGQRRRPGARSRPTTIVLPYNDRGGGHIRLRRARRPDRRGHRRAGRRQRRASSRPLPGLSRGPPRASRARWRAADLRRGHHRVPGRAVAAPRRGSGCVPDLTTLGKVIGGGMPIGAYGGRRDLMELVAPDGPVYQAGTLSGHPLSMAAGIATLDALDDDAYDRLEATGAGSPTGCRPRPHEAGRTVAIARVGSLLTRLLRRGRAASTPPTALAGDRERVRAVLPRDARAWRPAAALAVRGVVHLARARRLGRSTRRSTPPGRLRGVTDRGGPVPARLPSPAGRRDAGLVHAPGRPQPPRIPGDPRTRDPGRDRRRRRAVRRGHAPAGATASASTPRSSSPTSRRRSRRSGRRMSSWSMASGP